MTRDEAVAHILENALSLGATESLQVEVEETTLNVYRVYQQDTKNSYEAEFVLVERLEEVANVDAHRGFMWLTHGRDRESMIRGALNRLLNE